MEGCHEYVFWGKGGNGEGFFDEDVSDLEALGLGGRVLIADTMALASFLSLLVCGLRGGNIDWHMYDIQARRMYYSYCKQRGAGCTENGNVDQSCISHAAHSTSSPN